MKLNDEIQAEGTLDFNHIMAYKNRNDFNFNNLQKKLDKLLLRNSEYLDMQRLNKYNLKVDEIEAQIREIEKQWESKTVMYWDIFLEQTILTQPLCLITCTIYLFSILRTHLNITQGYLTLYRLDS